MDNPIEELTKLKAQLAALRKAVIELKDATEDDYEDVKDAVQKVSDALDGVPSVNKVIDTLDTLNTAEPVAPTDEAEVVTPPQPTQLPATSPATGSSVPAVVEAEVVESVPALLPSEREVVKRRRGEALTNAELRLMLQMRDEGMTQTEIAKRLNCSQCTISRLLAEWMDTTYTAKAVLKRDMTKLAERLVNTASNEEILEIFDREDVSTKKRKDAEVAPGVNVCIGIKLPGEK